MREQTIQAKKYDIHGIRFDLIAYNVAMETIERWRTNGESHYVTITNPHSVMLSYRDAEMRKATEMADLTLPDGVGIILAARLLTYPHGGRVTGPLLMLKLCDWGRKYGYRHFFYGGTEGVADRLVARLSKTYLGLQVAGTHCPSFQPLTEEEDKTIVEKISSTNPDIVWVGLGAPKQEKWMADRVGKIKAAAMIGVGAAFDFHSGNAKWAPEWIRILGLEWVYRLIREPKRMWRRNLDSPLFLSKVIQQRLSMILRSETKTLHSPEKE